MLVVCYYTESHDTGMPGVNMEVLDPEDQSRGSSHRRDFVYTLFSALEFWKIFRIRGWEKNKNINFICSLSKMGELKYYWFRHEGLLLNMTSSVLLKIGLNMTFHLRLFSLMLIKKLVDLKKQPLELKHLWINRFLWLIYLDYWISWWPCLGTISNLDANKGPSQTCLIHVMTKQGPEFYSNPFSIAKVVLRAVSTRKKISGELKKIKNYYLFKWK
jgi:hypothetical protein